MRLVLFYILFIVSLQVGAKTIRVAAPVSDGHLSQRYFVALLKLIAAKSNELEPQKAPIQIQPLNIQSFEYREDILLTRGFLDVMWAGSNDELESRFLPVKVPVVGGLLGYRVALLKKDNLEAFERMSVSDIKKLDACQGEFWTDSDILEANGFNVKRANTYDALPRMLMEGRCDYFPRGLHEAPLEVRNMANQYPDLVMSEKRILKYRLAAFMFFNPGEEALVTRLERSFKAAIEDGSIHKLRNQSGLFTSVFPLEKWQTSQFIELANPFFKSGESNQIPALYWLNLENPLVAQIE